MANQVSTMRHLCSVAGCVGPTRDLAADQGEVEHAEHEVQASEADEREDRAALAHDVACAVARAEEAVDEPGLAAEFGGHPADCVGNKGERECEHEGPEERASGF